MRTKSILSKRRLTESLDMISDMINSWDDDPLFTVREDYSGRFMYGETCFGIVTKDPSILSLIFIELAAQEALDHNDETDPTDWVRDLALSMKTDNMAMDMIYYFPGWELI